MLQFTAIDPLALIFSGRAYLILVEKLHPNVPLIDGIKSTVASLNGEEKAATVANAKRMVEYGNAVLHAAGAAR